MLKLGQRWAPEDENHSNQLSTSWRMPQSMRPGQEWRSIRGASQKDKVLSFQIMRLTKGTSSLCLKGKMQRNGGQNSSQDKTR